MTLPKLSRISAYSHQELGSVEQVGHYATARMYEIDEQIRDLQNERGMWVGIKRQYSVCPNCHGSGTVSWAVDMDERASGTCPKCQGSGKA